MAKFTNYSFKNSDNNTNLATYLTVDADGTSGGDYGSGNDKVFTISMWFNKHDDGAYGQGILRWSNVAAGYATTFLTIDAESPNGLTLYTNNSEGPTYAAFTEGIWHQLVVTRAAGATGATTMYVDGVSLGSNTGPGTDDEAEATQLLFGWISTTTSNLYGKILMTDMAIWNVELDLATIQSIYNSKVPNDLTLAASYTAGSGVDKSGNLRGYWRPDKAIFDPDVTTEWEISDEGLEGNDLASVGMDVLDRSGVAPGSSYNGMTINMAVGDRVTPGAS